jgi:hypothetical protein
LGDDPGRIARHYQTADPDYEPAHDLVSGGAAPMSTSEAAGPSPADQVDEAGAVFVTFVFTALIHEPASIATLTGILVLSVALDYGWKRSHPSHPVPVQVNP